MSTQEQANGAQAEAEILAELKATGHRGLSQSALLKTNRGRRNEALARLVKQGKIGNLGSARLTCYVLLEGQDLRALSLELACEALLAKAVPGRGKLKLFSRSTLEKGLKAGPKSQVMNAISRLCREKKLIPLDYGRGLYLHSSALAGFLDLPPVSAAESPASAPPQAAAADPAAVRAAYDRLVQRTKSVYVKISGLQAETGLPADVLKEWLMEECRRQRAVAGEGEFTLASEEDRALALTINGEPHLFVKFVS